MRLRNPISAPMHSALHTVFEDRESFPHDLILYMRAKDGLKNQIGNKNPFASSVLGPQYVRAADGSYTNAGAVAPVDVIDGRKMLRTCGAVTNLFSGDASIARSVSLTAQSYTLQVFGAGSVSCSYGTATVGSPLTFTAIAGSVTFTPAGATLWMLTATAYPVPYTPPGTTMPASHATTTGGPWFSLPQYDDAETSDGLWKRDGVELVVNGGFDSVVGWVNGSTGSASLTISNGSARIIGTDGSNRGCLYQIVPLVAGAKYIISYDAVVASGVGSIWGVGVGSGGFSIVNGKNKIEYTALSNNVFYIYTNIGGADITIDNISIQKLIPATKTNRVWAALDGEPDGVELVTNGGFDSDLSGWQIASGSGGTIAWGAGKIRISRTSSTTRAVQALNAVAGSRYQLSCDVSFISGTGAPFLDVGSVNTSTGGIDYGTVSLSTGQSGNLRTIFTAPSTGVFYVRLSIGTASGVYYFDNISIQRIQPKPMTLAWRGVMGVGSGDLVVSEAAAVMSTKAASTDIMYFRRESDSSRRVVLSYDGLNPSNKTITTEWARNETHIRFVQVSSSLNTFRAGYLRLGIDSSIQWDSWRPYDGSFNPSNLYKLLLDFANIYPLWHDTIALWNKQIDDATLLKEMLK